MNMVSKVEFISFCIGVFANLRGSVVDLRTLMRNVIVAVVCVAWLYGEAAEKLNWGDEFVMSTTPRVWTNSRGKTVEATWKHVAEDGNVIWLTYTSNEKTVQMKMEQLSKKDQKYVHDSISEFKKLGWIWWKGSYVDQLQYQDLNYIEKAQQYIREKSIPGYKDLQVVQVWTYGGLCNYGEYFEGRLKYDSGSRLIYCDEGIKGVLGNCDILKRKRMYWSGTMTYDAVNGRSNTVACYTDDFDWATYLVRLRMGLHRKDDTKFSAPEKSVHPPKVPPQEPNHPTKTGSGFFITRDGFFITNNHVVEGGKSYKVLTENGLQPAELVQVDPQTDLALMRIKGAFKPIRFAAQRKVSLGTAIATMGFPQPGLQGFSPKVTRGVISGETGFKGDVREYQIDASIQPGNSGGPLFNDSGELVGVVVATLRDGQVVNYAIKKAYLLAFLDSALKSSEGIVEGGEEVKLRKFEDVVDEVRSTCALVLTYE